MSGQRGRPRKIQADDEAVETHPTLSTGSDQTDSTPWEETESSESTISADPSMGDSAPSSATLTEEAVPENPTQPDIAATASATPAAESIPLAESPVEERIHALMQENTPCNGWYPIATVPRNGMPFRLSEKPEGEGTIVFWKRTRAFANATHTWEKTGFFCDWHTSQRITFDPKWWRERHR